MAAFDFPDTTGQATDGSFQYDAGGFTYAWNGEVWNIVSGGSGGGGGGGDSGGASVSVGVNPPVGSVEGDLWFNTNNGRLHIYYGPDTSGSTQWVDVSLLSTSLFTDYLPISGGTVTGNLNVNGNSGVGGDLTVDGDSNVGSNITVDGNSSVGGDLTVEGDATVGSLNGGPLAGFRNQIINGDFRVWERGTSFVNPGVSLYTADRWMNPGGAVARTITRESTAPSGFAYCYQETSGEPIQQAIELPGAGLAGPYAIGTQWTLSVWCDQDLSTSSPFARFRDNVTSATQSAITVPAFASTGEISNGFTRYSSTFTVDVSPLASNICLVIGFGGVALGTTTRYAGAQLEPGPVATPFEHRPIGTELALCQRYFFRSNENFINFCGDVNSTSSYMATASLPVSMRIAPNVPAASVTRGPTTFANFPTLSFSNSSPNHVALAATSTGAASSSIFLGGCDCDAEL